MPLSVADIQAPIAADMNSFERKFRDSMKSDVMLLNQITKYIVKRKGKQLRPMFVFLMAGVCGGVSEATHRGAALIELVHTASLVHDDVVDESKLRRGSATANEVWGNASSVLVGDFLFSRAFQLMVDDGSLQVLRLLADTSATIAEGEVRQLMTTNDPQTTQSTYLQVITAKTAALFAAAGELGAVVAPPAIANALFSATGLRLRRLPLLSDGI